MELNENADVKYSYHFGIHWKVEMNARYRK